MYENFFDNCKVTFIKNDNHWHTLREKGIGGSDAGIIVGVSKYKSKLELLEEKAGFVKRKFITNAAIEKGNRVEQPMIDIFQALYPEYEVIDTKSISLESRDFPFLHANLDAGLVAPGGLKGVLEIKSTTIRNRKMLDEWKENTVPKVYYCQAVHYLNVTKFAFVIIFAILEFPWRGDMREQETRTRVIWADGVVEDAKLILESEKTFWRAVEEKNQNLLKEEN